MIGDINIDLQAINKTEENKTNYQKSQNPLMKILKDNIVDKNCKLMNFLNTFKRGEYESQLDVIFTNRPDKIVSVQQNNRLDSDHAATCFIRKMKVKKVEEKLISIRKFKDIGLVFSI